MAGVVSAAIIEGKLVLGLDDGSIIDCGVAQGPQGLRGEPGPQGATGRAGTDGNTIHSIAGFPRPDLGRDGDFAINNKDWVIFGPKAGGKWGKGTDMLTKGRRGELTNPLVKMMPVNAGGGPGGGTVGGIFIGSTPPIVDEDGNPIGPGALWFDSEQYALYISVRNVSTELVWIITTPADRSVLAEEIPAGTFVIPAAADKDLAYSPVTELWYIYNAAKKQWIDLPPGEVTLSMQAILLEADPAIDETFEYDPADRDTIANGGYETNALCYINAPDHQTVTRVVVPKIDTGGFDWTQLLRTMQEGDELILGQVDPATQDVFRANYLTASEIVENTDTFTVEVAFQSENPPHIPLFGESVVIRFKAIANSAEYVRKDGDTMTGSLVMDDATALYLKDTQLDFRVTGESLKDINGDPVLDGSGNEQWDSANERFATIESLPPHLIRSDGTSGYDTGEPFGIQIEIDDGDTWKNQFKVNNRNGDIIKTTGGTGPQVVFGSGFPGNQNPTSGDPYWEAGEEGKVKITGIPTPAFENTDGSLAVNKAYVDSRDEASVLEIECIADAESLYLSSGVYKRLSDSAAADMIRGSQDGPGNPMLMTQFVFGTNVDVSAIKVNNIFGLTYDGSELNLYRSLNKYVNTSNRVVIEVEPISAESSSFQTGVPMTVTLERPRRVDADCLQCSTSDETICSEIGQLRQDIITIDEEIESLVGSMEKGLWHYQEPSDTTRPPLEGRFYLVKNYTSGTGGLGWNFTQEYSEAEAVVFSKKEWNPDSVDGSGGKNHTFDDVDVDELIDLLDRPDPDQLTGKITEVDKGTHGQAVIIAFDTFTAVGSPTNHISGVHETLLKIFKEPDGGSASEFVMKSGNANGVMTGDLTLKTTNDAIEWDHNNLDAKLTFQNTKSDGTSNYINLFKNGNGQVLNCDQAFRTTDNLILGSGKELKAKTSSGTDLDGRIKFDTGWMVHQWGTGGDRLVIRDDGGDLKFGSKKQAEWSTSGGKLKYNDNPRLEWNSNRVDILKPTNNTTTADGFLVRGATTSNNNYTSNTIGSQAGSLLVVKHVANQPDHIEYRGKITESTDIVNKAYVDNNVNGNVINGNWNGNNTTKITITKTSGVYYITGG